MSTKSIRGAGKCIFCGAGRLSKEHFWPSWSEKLFPRQSGAEHDEVFAIRSETGSLIRPVDILSRQGATTTKKLRVVCERCNNEWMGAIETMAKPVLIPLITGQSCVIEVDDQRTLATWIALKVMVGEQNKPKDAVVNRHQRDKFRTDCLIPSGLQIWIANYWGAKWSFSYQRHNATLTVPNPRILPSHGKNIQTTTFGFGRLFIHTSVYAEGGIDLQEFTRVGPQMTKLWPSAAQSINWPEPFVLLDEGANQLAGQLELIYRSPNVLRRPWPA